jgi:N-glycosylase/DNA lyase
MLSVMNLDRERRQLIFHIKAAQTPEQIRAAKKAVKAWMYKYPEDAAVERATRELAKKEAWLKIKGEWH